MGLGTAPRSWTPGCTSSHRDPAFLLISGVFGVLRVGNTTIGVIVLVLAFVLCGGGEGRRAENGEAKNACVFAPGLAMSESVSRGAGETEGDGREDSSEPEYAEESEVEVEVLRPERRGDEETEDEDEGGEENSIGESDSDALSENDRADPFASRMTAIEWALKRSWTILQRFRLTAGATRGYRTRLERP